MADVYASDNEPQPYNELYERPAILQMAGDLRGARVLEIGCAGGALTKRLVAAGAVVTAIDVSPRLVQLARQRLGSLADVRVADAGAGFGFAPSETFDVVVASLVLHYLRDWIPVLTEINRILDFGGRLVLSTHHPLIDHPSFDLPDYFAVEEITDRWTKGEREFEVHFYHRPLAKIFEDLASAGLEFESLVEPKPVDACRDLFPHVYRKLSTNPWFLFMTARKPAANGK
jgi:SAM-dependent methyltransferase